VSTTRVEVEFHLAIKQRFSPSGYASGKPAVRVSKGKPSLDHDEVAVAIRLQVPAALFRRPVLTANIVVPPGGVPTEITPEVQQGIADAVQRQLGIVMRVSAPLPGGTE
jgi:hypothetical protein